MNKFISIPSSGRLNYIREFMTALATNDRSDWTTVFSLEVDARSSFDKMYYMGEEILGPNFGILLRTRRLGACRHFFASAQSAFDCGADAVLHVDDDIVLSPDAIKLCDWYLSREHLDNEIGLCLCNEVSNHMFPTAISTKDTWRGLVGQGYCFTKAQWESFIRDTQKDNHGKSYDWAMIIHALAEHKIIMRPHLSRAKHIGVVGLHGAKAGVHLHPFPETISTRNYDEPFYIEL